MADERIDYEIGVSGDATIALKEIEKRLAAMGATAVKTAGKVHVVDASVDEFGDTLKRSAGYTALAERNLKKYGNEAIKTAGKVKVLDHAVTKMNRSARGVNASVNARASIGSRGKGGGKGDGSVSKFLNRAGSVAVGMIAAQFLKFGSMLYIVSSIIPALVTGIGSLVAGILALGGSLAPLLGLIVAYPGYLAAVGQGFLAVKLAMVGIGDALKVWADHTKTIGEVNEGIAKFTGGGINKDVGKPFIRSLSLMRTEMQYVGYGIQRTLLPGMQAILDTGQKMLPMVAGALSQTGGVIAKALDGIGKYLKTSRAQGLVGAILGTNVSIITSFGNAIEGVLGVVLETVNAAGPMLRRMAGDVAKFMGELTGKATAGAQSGGLGSYFDGAYAALKRFIGLFAPLLSALKNVMAIGKPLGDALIATWTKLSEKFRAFTESENGIAKITQWFQTMTPILYELGYLIADVAKGFAKMSQDSGFLMMSATFRTQLLPLIFEFINTANNQMFPALIKLASAAVEFMLAVQQSSATAFMFNVLGNVLEGIVAILNSFNGILLKVIAVIAVLWATIKMGKFAFWIFDTLVTKVKFVGLVFMSFIRLFQYTGVQYSLGLKQMELATTSFMAKVRLMKTAFVFAFQSMSAAVKSALISTGIGIIVVALGFFIDYLMTANAATQEAIDKNKGWAESLFEASGALVENNRQLVVNKLMQEGVIDLAKKAGINQELVIQATLGNVAAQKELQRQVEATTAANRTYGNGIWEDRMGLTAQGEAARDLGLRTGELGGIVKDTSDRMKEQAALVAGPYADAYTKAAQAVERMNLALQELKGLLDDNKARRQYTRDVLEARKMVREGIAAAGKRGEAFDPNKFFSEKTVKGTQRLDILEKPIDTALGRADTAISRKNLPKAQRILEKSARDTRDLFIDLFGEKKGKAMAEKILGPTLAKLDEVNKKVKRSAEADAAVVAEEAAGARAAAAASTDPRNYPMGGPASVLGLPDKSKLNLGAPNLGLPTTTKTQITFPGLDVSKAKLDALEAQLMRINNTPIKAPVVPKVPHGAVVPGAWSGGPINAGWKGWVGELGPEAFISSTGAVSIIGKNGPEIKQFHSSGYVVPNHELAPSMSVAAPTRTSSSNGDGGGGVSITIGDIHQATEFDVVQAVKRGLREAERDRRERG